MSATAAIEPAETYGSIYPTIFQPMQIFDSSLIFTAVLAGGYLLLFATRFYQRTVTAALLVTAAVLCITSVGAVLGGMHAS